MVYSEFISDIHSFDVNNMTFNKPKDGKQGSKRITIYVMDGTTKSPLYLQLGSYHCFGIKPQRGFQAGEDSPIQGYQMAIPLWDMEGPTEEQKVFLNVFNKIIDRCAKHLTSPEIRQALKKPRLEESAFIDAFSPIWRPKTPSGELDMAKCPTLYAKLPVEKDQETDEVIISAQFADPKGNDIIPALYIDKGFRFNHALLQVTSIYIGGAHIKLQVRIIEVELEMTKKRSQPLMLKPKPIAVPNEEEEEQEGQEQEEQQEEEMEEQAGEEWPKFEDYKEPELPPKEEEKRDETLQVKAKKSTRRTKVL